MKQDCGLCSVEIAGTDSGDTSSFYWAARRQVVIVIAGEMTVYTRNGNITIAEKQAVLVSPGFSYTLSMSTHVNAPGEMLIIEISDEYISRFMNYYKTFEYEKDGDLCTPKKAPVIEAGTVLEDVSASLYKHISSNLALSECILMSQIDTIILSIAFSGNAETHNEFHGFFDIVKKDFKSKVILHMHDCISNRRNIEDIANTLGYSIPNFYRLFKKSFGVSPRQWIIEKRLERSLLLLANMDSSISSVACEVGFDSSSYFISKFKEKYTVTPGQWKRSLDVSMQETSAFYRKSKVS